MKRILGLLLVSLSLTACAQHHGHYNHNYHHHHSHRGQYDWVVPAAIGGLIVYGVTRQNQQPVIVEQYPYPSPPQNCTEWREVYRNGVRFLERTCFNR